MADISQVVFPGLFPVMKLPVRPKTPQQTVHSFLLDQESIPVRLVPEPGIFPGSGSHSEVLMGSLDFKNLVILLSYIFLFLPGSLTSDAERACVRLGTFVRNPSYNTFPREEDVHDVHLPD